MEVNVPIRTFQHNLAFQTSSIDGYRHRESLDGLVTIPPVKQFAVIENHSNVVSVYSAKSGALVANMKCKAMPLSMCYVEPLQSLVVTCADSTMVRFNMGEAHHKSRYKQKFLWPTPDTQLCTCWQPAHSLLYSGSIGGRVNAWDIETREQKCCLEGHTDIVMNVLSIDYLDNVVSGSLDTSICVWDTYTETLTSRLMGHAKGVNSLTYSPTHRFLISSGFDHDVFIWSPFVSTLLYKLKGHREVGNISEPIVRT
jgi:WD40 repeat protein